tara:strand:- start:6363 stop:6926 length:564 start_codon:yes stop_codon:yes gene_type:complete
MRIISGKFKNKKLKFPKNSNTRPLKDSVKENIFNILQHSNDSRIKIRNAEIIDLFAGSGSFGLECLSRGADNAVLVENDIHALENLKHNIKILKIEKKALVFSENVFEFFKNKTLDKRFDLVFIDPPFKNNKYLDLINSMKKNKIFKNEHIIVIHREVGTDVNVNKYIKIIETRVYGRSEIFFGKLF